MDTLDFYSFHILVFILSPTVPDWDPLYLPTTGFQSLKVKILLIQDP